MREDFLTIADLVSEGSKVLDVGCDQGEMLEYLIKHKNIDGHGIDIDHNKIATCIKKGISAMQGDANTDLGFYARNSFDYIIASQTLQLMKNSKSIMLELLRIAPNVIISIPNFGYYYNRLYLLFKGEMPYSKRLSYHWYETPNIHFCTTKDFLQLCNEVSCVVKNSFFITENKLISKFNKYIPNLTSEIAIYFVIRKNST